MIRIVIADDHPIVLNGLEGVFKHEPDLEVAGKCVNGDETLASVRAHKPHVLVVDLRMPGKDGLEVARILHDEGNPTKVVIMSGELSDEETLEALRVGVKGVVLKELAPQLIAQCVRRVHSGGQWLDARASGRALETLLRRESAIREAARSLTPREIDLVKLAGQGMRNKEISEQLDIGEGTVKAHLHNIYKKLDIESRVELVLYAREKGIS